MGKFGDILLVSDFDRTLTNKEDEIPQANLDAIADFMREGGAFTVATGQSVETHGKRYNRVPMNAPCIVFNGSVLYDFERSISSAPARRKSRSCWRRCLEEWPERGSIPGKRSPG